MTIEENSLYTDATPNGQKISMTLEALGLKYTLEHVDISTDKQKEEWYLKINREFPSFSILFSCRYWRVCVGISYIPFLLSHGSDMQGGSMKRRKTTQYTVICFVPPLFRLRHAISMFRRRGISSRANCESTFISGAKKLSFLPIF